MKGDPALEPDPVPGHFRCGDHAAGGGGVKGFVLGWGEVAEARVAAAGVVPALDPLEDRRGESLLGGPAAGVEQFALHGRPERLDHGVVDAEATRPIEPSSPPGAQPLPERPDVYWAGSTGRRNTGLLSEVDARRGLRPGSSSRGFSGSGVEGVGDGGDVVGRPAGQVGAFGEVLAE